MAATPQISNCPKKKQQQRLNEQDQLHRRLQVHAASQFREHEMKSAIILLLALAASIVHAQEPPNFVIIYADDLGYAQTSVPMMKDKPELAHKLHQTPNLEKFAQRGMRFSNAYCPSPVCTSSRVSIQFGKTTARAGCISIHDVVMNKRKIDMKKHLSLAEMFKDCLLYTSPSPRDATLSRMPSSA